MKHFEAHQRTSSYFVDHNVENMRHKRTWYAPVSGKSGSNRRCHQSFTYQPYATGEVYNYG
jgi:hypothetical protein